MASNGGRPQKVLSRLPELYASRKVQKFSAASGFVVVTPHGRLLDDSVHSLDLTLLHG